MLAVFATALAAQMPDGYLDVTGIRVKPEKRAEFDAISKKIADANRKNKGDTWVSYEVIYGEQNTVYFISKRANFGAVEAGFGAFMGALSKAGAPSGMNKLLQDANDTSASTRSEIRHQRWDLTANAPADAAGYAKLLGQSRWARTAIIRVRPGRVADYEAQIKLNKEAQERANPGWGSFVSQSATGPIGVFYVTTFLKSLRDLDKIKPLAEVRGSSYASYQKTVAETVLGTEIIIGRFLPELSNPPEDVVAADPKFWRPKPSPPPPAKPAGAADAKK